MRMLVAGVLGAVLVMGCRDGATGTQGPRGEPGVQGPKGDTGEQGLKGDKGDTGEMGVPGAEGPRGSPGTAGQSVTGELLPSGNEHCPTGGVKFQAATGVVYVCNGATGPTGPSGGAPGPTGPAGPGALVCRDARGAYVGVSAPYVTLDNVDSALCIHIDDNGFEWMYRFPSGAPFLPPISGVQYSERDCTGLGGLGYRFAPPPRVPFLVPGETQLRVVNDTAVSRSMTSRSASSATGGCYNYPSPPTLELLSLEDAPVVPGLTLPAASFTAPLHRERM